MIDFSWLAPEAGRIHDLFVSVFYTLVGLLLVIGIVMDYFKWPLGGVPNFQITLSRALIAVILLVAYPQISNAVAEIADIVSNQLGHFDSFDHVLTKAGDIIHQRSFHWTNPSDWVVVIISYIVYFFLYIAVFMFNSGIGFCMTLIYAFSPLLIALFVLPQTASACSGLFRSLFELAGWKIVLSVLASLLWNGVLKIFDQQTPDSGNYITQLVVLLILAISVICTPLIVNGLLNGGITQAVSQFTGLAMSGLTYGIMNPNKMASAPANVAEKGYSNIAKPLAVGAAKKSYGLAKNYAINPIKGGVKTAANYGWNKTKSYIAQKRNPPIT